MPAESVMGIADPAVAYVGGRDARHFIAYELIGVPTPCATGPRAGRDSPLVWREAPT